jgi:hypothetical protein
MRVPRVAGVAGGVGTSLLADALHAIDDGVYVEGPVDVLVCRTTVTSLGDAHRVLALVPYPPVLAVVADIPDVVPAAVRARIRMVSRHAVLDAIPVPFVEGWRDVDDPYSEASWVLSPEVRLPKSMRGFAKSMRGIWAAVEPLLGTAPARPEEPNPDTGTGTARELTRPRLA